MIHACRLNPHCMLAQEVLKRGDGLVFDSGAPDGDEEGGTVYNIQASKRHSNASGTFVQLGFGFGQINMHRIKVASAADPVQYNISDCKMMCYETCAGDLKLLSHAMRLQPRLSGM